jgi:hypothetical protein
MIGLAALPVGTLAQRLVGVSPSLLTVDLSALALDTSAIIGGGTATGTVTLSAGAPADGGNIMLSSSNSAAATVPATVTVLEGATSAMFAISTFTVSSRTTVAVSATYGGSTKTATLAVYPPLPAAALDIDGDGTYDAPTDGLLVLRYLFGNRDESLVAQAVASNAARKTASEINDHLDWIRPALDVDQNDSVDALSDGLLIIRYLSDLRGGALISGAIGSDAVRKEAIDIENYLASLTPAPASLLINEVNPNLASGRDLVELRAISGGSVAGMTLELDLTGAVTLANFPPILVAAGDLLVVHMTPAAGETTEIGSKQECAAATCFNAAWDIAGAVANVPFTNRILVVRQFGAIVDAVPFAVAGGMTATFPENLQALQAAGLWVPADCGGSACTYVSTPTATAVSVDWTGSDSLNSVQRKPNANTKSRTDWNAAGAATFGQPNP